MNIKDIRIIQPDDWHVHLREGSMLEVVSKQSSRVNKRCIAMPNLNIPITLMEIAVKYISTIKSFVNEKDFKPLIPCFLTADLDLNNFEEGLRKEVFIGAKLYPNKATTNSNLGISNIESIFPSLEILEKNNKPLLVHGEKVSEKVDIFDREKYFIDDELQVIIKKFPNLKVVLEHVSSKYGADFVNQNNNMAATITPQHLTLTKKDVFLKDSINPHHFCMPVVKEEEDLISLRKYATSGNSKFFVGTDSAPHHVDKKHPNLTSMPGIFSAPCSIEIYTTIFEEENALENLEKFTSINGPKFYEMPINTKFIELTKEKWPVPEFTIHKDIKIKNFLGGKELNWKLKE